ncbi:MAG: ATP-binding protein [Proteobacteria bacterium]|nr:ATP-binding protein [Cystobacterineae bacterium]MCL2258783.1 ATP-binding protein [Cystobacterineae bacterium]MCL2314689.1 ATP-binding protein [Pseudomonadota bacterium]
MRISLATRILIGFSAVLLASSTVSLVSILTIRQNQIEVQLLGNGYLQLAKITADVQTLHNAYEKETALLAEERDLPLQQQLARLALMYFPSTILTKLNEAKNRAQTALALAPHSEKMALENFANRFEEASKRYAAYEADTKNILAEIAKAREEFNLEESFNQLQKQEVALQNYFQSLQNTLSNHILFRLSKAQDREQKNGILIVALSLLSVLIGLLATIVSIRHLRPIRTLHKGIVAIREGDSSAFLGLKGDDDIALLAREFDAMVLALKERQSLLENQQSQLLQAKQLAAAGRISAQLAHEVRNPLSSIGLNAELLLEQLSQTPFSTPQQQTETKELISAIVREVDRVADITEEYLKLARLPPPSLQLEDMNALTQSILHFHEEEFKNANIRIETALFPLPLFCKIDEAQIRQVVLNLLKNAKEAMCEGGLLQISTRQEDAFVLICFADSGKGMEPNVLSEIFKPFFTTKEGGSGLGLALSVQLLSMQGGSLAVTKTGPEGTEFVLKLPRA